MGQIWLGNEDVTIDPLDQKVRLKVALDGAVIEPGAGRPTLAGAALAELANQYVKAENVVQRLCAWMDIEALRAVADGRLTLNLEDEANAQASAAS